MSIRNRWKYFWIWYTFHARKRFTLRVYAYMIHILAVASLVLACFLYNAGIQHGKMSAISTAYGIVKGHGAHD